MPADQTNSKDVITKKLIVCPISSHDPLSVTFRKKVMVIPSVRLRAIRNKENGGSWS